MFSGPEDRFGRIKSAGVIGSRSVFLFPCLSRRLILLPTYWESGMRYLAILAFSVGNLEGRCAKVINGLSEIGLRSHAEKGKEEGT